MATATEVAEQAVRRDVRNRWLLSAPALIIIFFAAIGPICLAMGLPLGVLPLLLAVEVIPDIFRTVGNVTADLAATRIVAGEDGAGEGDRVIE